MCNARRNMWPAAKRCGTISSFQPLTLARQHRRAEHDARLAQLLRQGGGNQVEWSYITASMQAAPGTRLSLRTLSCLASAILSARRLFTPPCAHRSAPSTHHEGQQVHALVLRLLQQRVDPAVIALWGWQAGNGRIWRVSERSAASTRQCVAAAGQGQAVMLLHAGEPQQQVPPLPAAGVPPPWPGSPLTHGPQRAHVAQHACRAQQGRGRPGSC